jgi:branched-chain amino acid transport system substrate-binding protein
MTRRTAIAAAAGLSALSALGLAKAQGNEPIRIGVLIALSGPAAAYGAEERRAVEAVFAQINAQGGIKGRKVELVVRDTKTNPTEAARLANQVIADDKVIAIIGATTGSETLAFADAAMRAQVPVFPMVGTPSVTDPEKPYSKWIYRMSVPLTTDLPASFNRMVKDGKKKMAVFSEEDAYGQQGSAMASSSPRRPASRSWRTSPRRRPPPTSPPRRPRSGTPSPTRCCSSPLRPGRAAPS